MSKWAKQKADATVQTITILENVAPSTKPAESHGVWFRVKRGKSMASGITGWFVERLDVSASGVKVTHVWGPDLRGICENRRDQEEEMLSR